jgi:hypothetical protein
MDTEEFQVDVSKRLYYLNVWRPFIYGRVRLIRKRGLPMASVAEQFAERMRVEIAEPEIVGGKIIGARVVDRKITDTEDARLKTKRARAIDAGNLDAEVVAALGLGLTILVMKLL